MDAQTELRQIMTNELSRLKSRNESYSLRAFARKLDLVPSAVSEIMSGKRPISRRFAMKILSQLAVHPAESNRIVSGIPQSGSRSGSESTKEYVQLDMDAYHSIADWYYFAILSLSETKGFREDPRWIAKRLNIKVPEAMNAIKRLERMGMLKRDKQGQLVHAPERFRTSSDLANIALRQSHFQNLALAGRSLETDSVDKRDFSSMTMAIDPDLLPEAKKRIQKFRRSLCEFLESSNKTEVYRICIQLIPLSKEDT